VVTDGGSQAMSLMVLGVCGPRSERPLMLLDPAYTNYVDLARLCVEHNIWLISDKAYRQLHYTDAPVSSVWTITEAEVPAITGRRISIESASKVWNACGLRMGALVTDSAEFHGKAVAELTANICSNALGQKVFRALAHLDRSERNKWYTKQRAYYAPMLTALARGFAEALPGIIVSLPQASLHAVVDLCRIAAARLRAPSNVASVSDGLFFKGRSRWWLLLALREAARRTDRS
jgi:aspartate/methionine/tyrosine aminotransferase